VADTPGCAYALARHGLDALCVVPPGGAAAALAPLPIEALRLEPTAAAGLRRLGFDTVGQLAAAPRAPLARRFGNEVLRRLDQALGHAPEPLEPVAPPDLIRVRQGFPEPIATPDDLTRITALLTEQICEKLRQADLGASRLDLVFLRVDGTPHMVRVGTAAATRDAAHLTRLLSAQIETVDPGFGIDSVWLAAPLTGRLGARQMISDLAAAPVADLTSLIDTLLNRLGSKNLYRVAAVESDIPERSVRRIPPGAVPAGNWPAELPRPARLLSPPRAVDAVALLPDHPPVQFTWRKRAHRVRRADGPERIFGEWWRADDEFFAVRDYFQVEDEEGRRFWLFREGDGEHPESGDMGWYLHGMFG
jgi:protein ImuB